MVRSSDSSSWRVDGIDLEPGLMRPPIEAADELDVDPAHRQVDREPAGDIGVRGRSEDEIRAGVLEVPGVDLVTMAERRQVATVRRREADPSGHTLAGRSIDDLHLDRDLGRGQDLDRSLAGRIAQPDPRQQVPTRDGPAIEVDRGVRRQPEVDDDGARGRLRWIVARRPPADDRRRSPTRTTGGWHRTRPDDRPEVDLDRTPGLAIDPDLDPRSPSQRVARSVEQRDAGDDHVAPRPTSRERLEVQGDRLGAGLELDRVEP